MEEILQAYLQLLLESAQQDMRMFSNTWILWVSPVAILYAIGASIKWIILLAPIITPIAGVKYLLKRVILGIVKKVRKG